MSETRINNDDIDDGLYPDVFKKIDTNFLKNKNYVVPNQIFDSDINDDVLQNFKSIIAKLIK